MENLDPDMDNQDPEVTNTPAPPSSDPSTFSWKSKLSPDVQKSPTMQKFDDSPEGLAKAVESHLSLEKLLGHEKVPVPKGADDKEGWSRFNKAFSIPEKADGYGLQDQKIPDSMKGMTFDKGRFAEVVHKYHLTPEQAKGLWNEYGSLSMGAYNKAIEQKKSDMARVVNELRTEWGDGYDGNVELGQTVISKFAGDKETEEFLNASLTSDPRFIKFLAKIGSQFAENKIGDFQYARFAKTPDQAMAEIDSILADPKHPYNDISRRQEERDRAIDYVNGLYAVVSKSQG